MSLFDDDASKMSQHHLINDRDAEAILAGSSSDAEFDELTFFLGRIKEAGMQAEPTMSVALNALLSGSPTMVTGAHQPALRLTEQPKPRSRRVLRFAAGLSLGTKLALGAGLAAAGATGAAAVGVLPDRVQHAAAAVVRTVTPFEVPDSARKPTSPPAVDEPTTTFGERVSTDANGTSDATPGVDGAAISSEATAKQDDARCTNVPPASTLAPHAATVDAASLDVATVDAATVDAATVDAAPVDAATVDAVKSARGSVNGASADQPGCKPSADAATTDGANAAAGRVPVSVNSGAGADGAVFGGKHHAPDVPSSPALPALPAQPSVARTQDAPAAPAVPAVPAVPATHASVPSAPGPPADGGVTPPGPVDAETPPATPGNGHHS